MLIWNAQCLFTCGFAVSVSTMANNMNISMTSTLNLIRFSLSNTHNRKMISVIIKKLRLKRKNHYNTLMYVLYRHIYIYIYIDKKIKVFLQECIRSVNHFTLKLYLFWLICLTSISRTCLKPNSTFQYSTSHSWSFRSMAHLAASSMSCLMTLP